MTTHASDLERQNKAINQFTQDSLGMGTGALLLLAARWSEDNQYLGGTFRYSFRSFLVRELPSSR
jgi:hypothetical protein